MLVKDWMSKKVITVEESDVLSEAINTLKRNKIRRLPVMKGEKLVGIVSDRDIKEASPSKATSLDIWEVHYLMSKIKVKDIMTRGPLTIGPEVSIEKAAMIMHDNKIGGLPVLDEKNKLIGILSEQDIFEALINITGARISGMRVSVVAPDEAGSIKEICDHMRKFEFKCISILTTKVGVEEGKRKVMIRFQANSDDISNILQVLQEYYENVNFTDD